MKNNKKTQEKQKRPTAEKRILQAKKRALINHSFKSKVKTMLRKFELSLKGSESEKEEAVRIVYSVVDKAEKRGIFKPNKAARIKSRIMAKCN